MKFEINIYKKLTRHTTIDPILRQPLRELEP